MLWRPEKAMAGLYLRGAKRVVCVFPKYFDSEAVKRPQKGGKGAKYKASKEKLKEA